MGQVLDFRPFQSAAQQARRAGVPRQMAVREVLEARQRGEEGYSVSGRYRLMASAHGRGPSPRGAA